MSLKQYTWHSDIHKGHTKNVRLSALAESPEEAQELILNYIKDEKVREEMVKFFEITNTPPSIGQKSDVTILHQGVTLII